MSANSGRVRTVFLCLMGLALLLVGGPFVLLARAAIPPSADDLKTQFQAKRTALEALVQLMNADGKDGFCLRGAGLAEMKAQVSRERLEEYRARMKDAEVICVWRRSQASIEISVWAFGFPGTDLSRGFVWSLVSLPNEFACISPRCFPEGFKRKRWEKVYERIAPEWAIFAF